MGVASSKPQDTIDLSVNNTAIRRLLTRLAIKTTARFYKYDGPCVPLSSRLILKRGSDVGLAEVATMAFVAAHTKIPVPRVHCAFTRKSMTYIVMERVRGQTLAEALPALFDDGWTTSSRSCGRCWTSCVLSQLLEVLFRAAEAARSLIRVFPPNEQDSGRFPRPTPFMCG